jgi:hypothetical protein
MQRLIEAGGNYEWIIGDEGNRVRDRLMSYITEPALQTLVDFNSRALGLDSVYKENLIQ